MSEETKEIVVQSAERELMLAPVMDLKTAKARLAEFQEFVKQYLVEEEDYGIIPGTTKPTLYKPGADKLCELYGLADEYEILTDYSREDWSAVPPLFDYTIRCVLRSKRSGVAVASGLGSCNSYEGKYRWRDLKRRCPNCGQETIIKGKEEYGGGWICWKKEGRSNGCGAKFDIGDERIANQTVGRVDNDDIATLKNTILKLGKKRCLGSNTPILVSSSSGVSRCRVDTVFQMWGMKNREPLMLPMEGGWGRIIGMSREERPQAIRIRLADGSAIFCSGEHIWPTTRGEQLTADIQVGDVMIRNRPELSGQMTVDESIAWTVGFYLAEGHCDRGHVKFTMAADEIESFIPMIEKAASIVGGSILASRRPKGNIGDIFVTGPAFTGLMQQFVLGTDCYGKHLSKYSWRQGKEFIRLLLKGYLDGDGHSEDYRGLQDKWIVGFTGENFALADDLRCICAILGYRHRLKRGISTCGGKEFPTYEGWISFDLPRYNGKNLEEVTDIQIVNQKSVLYDIEVEDPHLFILPNGIVSHNSKIDATLSATRSSGIFTQDMEDIQPAIETHEKKAASGNEQAQALVTDAQRKELFKAANAHGWRSPILAAWLLRQYGFKSTAEIPASKFDEIMTRLADQGPKSDKGQAEGPADLVTKDQIKLFWAVVKKQGWTEEQAHTVLKTLGVEHVHLMSKAQLDEALKRFAKPKSEQEREPEDDQRRDFEDRDRHEEF